MDLLPLPPDVQRLLHRVGAPSRLINHLALVHDVATHLCDGLSQRWPATSFDRSAVLFGAATHDIGKVLHPSELTQQGHSHEAAGQALLRSHGVSAHLARFTVTHARWEDERCTLEDRLVALADKVWKGRREARLEQLVTEHVAAAAGLPRWRAFLELDLLLTDLAADADDRLAAQWALSPH